MDIDREGGKLGVEEFCETKYIAIGGIEYEDIRNMFRCNKSAGSYSAEQSRRKNR